MITDYLKSYNILTNEEIETFLQKTVKRNVRAQDYFIRKGETCKEVAFIVSGIFRSFYISDKGEEITYCIIFPNNLMTAYSSFITGQSSTENMQAITDVELLIISKNTIHDLEQKNPNWVKFLKIVAEQQ